MKRRHLLVVAGLLIVVFGMGWWLGSRTSHNHKSLPYAVLTTTPPPAPAAKSSQPGNSAPCVDIRNATPLVGKTGCVAGVVVRVFSSRSGNIFLDFCQDYRTCPFTSVIFASDTDKFGKLESLQGRRVEIRGDVTSYQDRAEIVIRDPQQVRGAP